MRKWDIEFPMELGCDHYLAFTKWAPDRALNPQYADLPDTDRLGALIAHKKPDGRDCLGAIHFDCEQARRGSPGRPTWRVIQWEPLTLEPSIRCSCGDYGFIREGKWVRA